MSEAPLFVATTFTETERAELASQIGLESRDAIATVTKNGMFVLRLKTVFATGHV